MSRVKGKKKIVHCHVTMSASHIKRLNELTAQAKKNGVASDRSDFVRKLIDQDFYSLEDKVVKKRHYAHEIGQASYYDTYGKAGKKNIMLFIYPEQKKLLLEIGSRYSYARILDCGKGICTKEDVVDVGLIVQWMLDELTPVSARMQSQPQIQNYPEQSSPGLQLSPA